MLPDTGERYLSTALFDEIPADMTQDEVEIANSTAGYRFGGPHIGGATDLFDACKDGSLQKMLGENSVVFNCDENTDPYSFLPGWLHQR